MEAMARIAWVEDRDAEGPLAEHLAKMFEVSKRRAGIVGSFPELRRDQFRRPLVANEQLPLFSG